MITNRRERRRGKGEVEETSDPTGEYSINNNTKMRMGGEGGDLYSFYGPASKKQQNCWGVENSALGNQRVPSIQGRLAASVPRERGLRDQKAEGENQKEGCIPGTSDGSGKPRWTMRIVAKRE